MVVNRRVGPLLAASVVVLVAGIPSAGAEGPAGLSNSLSNLGLAPAPDAGAGAPLLGSLGDALGGIVDAFAPDAPDAAPDASSSGALDAFFAPLAPVLDPLFGAPDNVDVPRGVPAAPGPDVSGDLAGALPDVERVVANLPDALPALPPATLPPLGESGIGSGGTAQPQLPAQPGLPRVPAAPGLPGGPGPNLGSQTLGADMGPRQGLGDNLQAWASQTFGPAFAWYAELPPEMQQLLGGAAALLLSGLATAAALLTGFRHLQKDNLLEHTFRHQVLNLLREHPGLHLREVARRLGLTATNASYHLRVLEKHGFIRSERLNGKRVYVPAVGPEAKRRFLAQALLHRDTRARVLHALASQPGSNQTRLASITAQHQGAVSWHLRQLVGAGLVREERSPRECRYQLTPLGAELAAGHVAMAASPVGPAHA